MDRREFLTAAMIVPTAASIDGLDSIAPTTPPAKIGETEIAQLRDSADSIKRGDLRWGGGFGFDAALVEARRARDLLGARCPDRLRSDLLVTVGWLACNAGFMAFDIDRYRDASRLWTLAASCAEEADNKSLHARVMGSMARQSIWLDRPDDGIAVIDRALADDQPQLVPTELAMLWALRARGCGQAGDAASAEQAIGEADRWLAARRPDECQDRPWVAHYSQAHHWGDTGLAWDRVASASDNPHAVEEAAGRHQASADAHGADSARSHALSLLALARLDVTIGDLDRGVAVGQLALQAAQLVRSGRVREDLLGLHVAAAPHVGRTDIADLRDRITSHLLAA